MSDPEKPQWKPDLRRKVHKDAAKFGLRVIYDAFDNPAEPAGQKKARDKWIRSQFAKKRYKPEDKA